MGIILPSSDTGENKDNSKFSVDFETSTQKKKISTLADLYSDLAKETVKAGELALLKKDLTELKSNVEKASQRIENAQNLVYLGLLGLLFVLAGLVFGYVEFVYSGSKNDDYKYLLSDKVTNQEVDLRIFKQCLKSGGWNNCF